tara:strand:- start:476 stop:697 length:222 start_codon:yes stop_codon:yes gene_type:complete
MRDFNTWANNLSPSFATEKNARRSFAKKVGDAETKGAHLVFQRADGRFSNVVLSPEPALFGWWAANGVGVWAG